MTDTVKKTMKQTLLYNCTHQIGALKLLTNIFLLDNCIEIQWTEFRESNTWTQKFSFCIISAMVYRFPDDLDDLWDLLARTIDFDDYRPKFETQKILTLGMMKTVSSTGATAYLVYQASKTISKEEVWLVKCLAENEDPFVLEITVQKHATDEKIYVYRVESGLLVNLFKRKSLNNIDSSSDIINPMMQVLVDELIFDAENDCILVRSVEVSKLEIYLRESLGKNETGERNMLKPIKARKSSVKIQIPAVKTELTQINTNNNLDDLMIVNPLHPGKSEKVDFNDSIVNSVANSVGNSFLLTDKSIKNPANGNINSVLGAGNSKEPSLVNVDEVVNPVEIFENEKESEKNVNLEKNKKSSTRQSFTGDIKKSKNGKNLKPSVPRSSIRKKKEKNIKNLDKYDTSLSTNSEIKHQDKTESETKIETKSTENEQITTEKKETVNEVQLDNSYKNLQLDVEEPVKPSDLLNPDFCEESPLPVPTITVAAVQARHMHKISAFFGKKTVEEEEELKAATTAEFRSLLQTLPEEDSMEEIIPIEPAEKLSAIQRAAMRETQLITQRKLQKTSQNPLNTSQNPLNTLQSPPSSEPEPSRENQFQTQANEIISKLQKREIADKFDFFSKKEDRVEEFQVLVDKIFQENKNTIVEAMDQAKYVLEQANDDFNTINAQAEGYAEKSSDTVLFMVREALQVKSEKRSDLSEGMIIEMLYRGCQLSPFLQYCSPLDLRELARASTLRNIDLQSLLGNTSNEQYRTPRGSRLPRKTREMISERGQTTIDCFILLQGSLEIVDYSELDESLSGEGDYGGSGDEEDFEERVGIPGISRPVDLVSSPDEEDIYRNNLTLLRQRKKLVYTMAKQSGETQISNWVLKKDEEKRTRLCVPGEFLGSEVLNGGFTWECDISIDSGLAATAAHEGINQISLCSIPADALRRYVGRRGEDARNCMVLFWKHCRLWVEIKRYEQQIINNAMYLNKNVGNKRRHELGAFRATKPMNVLSSARIRTYQAGEDIFTQGQPRHHFFLVLEGSCEYVRCFPDHLETEGIIPRVVRTGGVLLSGDFSFMDGEDHLWLQKLVKGDAVSQERASKAVQEKRKKEYCRFEEHKNSLLALTRVEVCVVPIQEIAKCLDLMKRLLTLAYVQYPVTCARNEDLVRKYHENRIWEKQRIAVLQEVVMGNEGSALQEEWFHSPFNNESQDHYKSKQPHARAKGLAWAAFHSRLRQQEKDNLNKDISKKDKNDFPSPRGRKMGINRSHGWNSSNSRSRSRSRSRSGSPRPPSTGKSEKDKKLQKTVTSYMMRRNSAVAQRRGAMRAGLIGLPVTQLVNGFHPVLARTLSQRQKTTARNAKNSNLTPAATFERRDPFAELHKVDFHHKLMDGVDMEDDDWEEEGSGELIQVFSFLEGGLSVSTKKTSKAATAAKIAAKLKDPRRGRQLMETSRSLQGESKGIREGEKNPQKPNSPKPSSLGSSENPRSARKLLLSKSGNLNNNQKELNNKSKSDKEKITRVQFAENGENYCINISRSKSIFSPETENESENRTENEKRPESGEKDAEFYVQLYLRRVADNPKQRFLDEFIRRSHL